MTWRFEPDRPIYIQLQEQLKLAIVSGQYPPGGKLPAVRDLAEDASVNPNTVQRALAELEREMLVYAQRTSGRFVTEESEMIEKIKTEMALKLVDEFVSKMAAIGYSKDETNAMLTKIEEVEERGDTQL
ncbi:MAG: GntR family transcriptional regulator [Oscillospiraceae bacterium]|nr:GntR family transcriptional regulator [Oscillospiraceae bacterium]